MYSMKTSKTLIGKKSSAMWIIAWALQTSSWGTSFSLPNDTQGLQQTKDICYPNCVFVRIPNANCNLYFPDDGSQPNTSMAGMSSGARHIGQLNSKEITDWWIRVFGGEIAIAWANSETPLPLIDLAPPMYTNANQTLTCHLIQVNGTDVVKRQFWQTFRHIAEDSVGRVLLYRLLIEIRRINTLTNDGCCEGNINLLEVNTRNACRHIQVLDNSGKGFSFNSGGIIRVDFTSNLRASVLSSNNGIVTTVEESCPFEVALFHEMLHWFHFLRNFNRYNNSSSNDPNVFKYALRCYYGNQNELGIWDSQINNEEISNILGTPNHADVRYQNLIAQNAFSGAAFIPHNDSFLNGDDLSENVFRISIFHRSKCHMRFGHCGYQIIPVALLPQMPNRFVLANTLARNCYCEITGIPFSSFGWELTPGQAIKY